MNNMLTNRTYIKRQKKRSDVLTSRVANRLDDEINFDIQDEMMRQIHLELSKADDDLGLIISELNLVF